MVRGFRNRWFIFLVVYFWWTISHFMVLLLVKCWWVLDGHITCQLPEMARGWIKWTKLSWTTSRRPRSAASWNSMLYQCLPFIILLGEPSWKKCFYLTLPWPPRHDAQVCHQILPQQTSIEIFGKKIPTGSKQCLGASWSDLFHDRNDGCLANTVILCYIMLYTYTHVKGYKDMI